MYWNIHSQRQLCDQLEYGRFNIHGRQNIEQYTIAQIERVKHLKPRFSEYEIISKLSYLFHKNIQLAVYTQGIKTVSYTHLDVYKRQEIRSAGLCCQSQSLCVCVYI